jgi:hypothetical protein
MFKMAHNPSDVSSTYVVHLELYLVMLTVAMFVNALKVDKGENGKIAEKF